MFDMKSILIVICLINVVCNLEVPAGFKKCKRTSNNEEFSKCMLDAVHVALPKLGKGLPEYGLESCQPIKIKNFTVGEGTGIVHVVQKFQDAEIYNLVHIKIKKLNGTISDKGLHVRAETFLDHLILKSKYNLKGQLLLFPIYGNGKSTVDLYNVNFVLILNAVPYKKQGETYLNFKEFKVEVYPKKIVFNFENLFDGNKALGDNINQVLNDNDLDVFRDIKQGYEEVFSNVMVDIANTVASKVPFNKLFPPN